MDEVYIIEANTGPGWQSRVEDATDEATDEALDDEQDDHTHD